MVIKNQVTSLFTFACILFFVNQTLSQSVILRSPERGQGIKDKTPTFIWNSSGTGSLSHTLYIDTDVDPYSGGNTYSTGSSSSYTLSSALTPGQVYYWGIKLNDGSGTRYSGVQSFTIINTLQGGLLRYGNTITTSASGAESVFAADVDGDGDMDALSASESDNTIAWYENNGSGNFTSHTISSSANYASGVYACDMDKDGDMDVISSSYADGEIDWYENNGAESFTEHTITSKAFYAECIDVKDMDGDGDMDVISTSYGFNYTSGDIIWYENNGSQTFTPHIVTSSLQDAKSVFAADVNNDGNMDLLTASNGDNEINWFENDGTGNFTQQNITVSASGAECVYATDMDNDQDLDVLSASSMDNTIAWYENNGSGSFTNRTITASATATKSVYAADADGDGDQDVFAVTDGMVIWLENDGTQNFTKHIISIQISGGHSVYAADLNNDGDMDVLSASYHDNKIAWYDNTTPPPTITLHYPQHNQGFTDKTPTFSWSSQGIGAVSHTVYIDTDANPFDGNSYSIGSNINFTPSSQLMTGTTYYWAVEVADNNTTTPSVIRSFSLINYGQGGYIATESEISTWYSDGANSVFSADLDNDGDLDVLSASFGNNRVSWFENDGYENFSEHALTTTATYAKGVYAADIDTDGDLDVLSVSSNEINWFENDGNANFSIRTVSNIGGDRVTAEDLDSDGDMDVITDNGAWYENDGSQNFTARTAFGQGDMNFPVDLDKDGDMDIINANSDDDEVNWFENNGAEVFTKHNIASSANGVKDVYAGDVDNDGDIDVLSASASDNTIAWYENNGSENFTYHIINSSADNARSIYMADMEGDGDMDVLSAASGDDKVAWYENNGSEVFTERIITTSADGAACVFAIDLNHDGDIDVLSASNADDKIAWYDNTTPEIPTVITDAVSNIELNSAYGNGEVTYLGNPDPNQHGICWNISGMPTINDNKTEKGPVSSTGNFNSYIPGLSSNTTYYVRAYATNYAGTTYGSEKSFTTLKEASVTTEAVTSISTTSATGNGNIIDLGSSAVFQHGFCWNTTGSPSIADNKTQEGMASTTGAFTSSLNGLSSNTTYFVKAYVTNSEGTVYGDEVSFTTLPKPTVNLLSPQNTMGTTNKTPQFYWSGNGLGNIEYTLYISAQMNPFDTGNSYNTGSDEYYTISSSLTPGNTYYWGVKIKDDNDSTNSVTHSLTVLNTNHGGSLTNGTSVSSNADGATGVYAADLDNDGDNDLVSSSENDDKIAWYENDGNENFTSHVITTSADGAQDIYAADIDNDGDMDIISASANDNKIAWFKNNGTNSFTSHVISTSDQGAKAVHAADLNNDGYMDIISAPMNDTIKWYKNNGTQSFTSHIITASVDSAQSVFAADINNDGYTDVVTASSSDDKIAWHENDGNGNFTSHTITTLADGASSVFSLDIDKDNDMDVLSASAYDHKIAWYENDGSENFASHSICDTAIGANSVYAADLDADNDFDIYSTANDQLIWYENNGYQIFAAHAFSSNVSNAKQVYSADFQGDGDLDVISASYDNDNIYIHKNVSVPTISLILPLQEYSTIDKTPTFEWKSEGSGTLSHTPYIDTDIDPFNGGTAYNAGANQSYTVSSNLSPGTVYYWGVKVSDEYGSVTSTVRTFTPINSGQGGYTSSGLEVSGSISDIYSTHASDMDNDGDKDILASFHNDNQIGWFENNGTSNVTLHIISTMNYPNIIYGSDINKDGNMDVIISSSANDKIAWYENDGSSNFTSHIITDTLNAVNDIYPGDVDSDGDIDIIASSHTDKKVVWYENNGMGSFSVHTINPFVDGVNDIHAADMDKDGDMDVIAASSQGDKLEWYENDGLKNFTTHVINNALNSSSLARIADINKDGYLDIISIGSDWSGYYSGDIVYWFENDGSESYTQHLIDTVDHSISRMIPADMNGDGNTDIVVSSGWYQNDGMGNFSIGGYNSDYSSNFYTSDFDSDGDIDIVSEYSNNLVLFRNNNSSTDIHLKSPKENAGTVNNPPVLSWDCTGIGDQTYTLYISDNDNPFGYYAAFQYNVGTDKSFTLPSELTPGIPYYWGVEAMDENGVSRSVVKSFTIINEDQGGVITEAIPISSTLFALRDAFSIDIDSDGDMDVLSACQHKLNWFENDGSENFTNHNLIITETDILNVHAADLDNDGDIDILSSSKYETHSGYDPAKLCWFENDGSENFTKHIIKTLYYIGTNIYAEDINGDGKMDILAVYDGKISWFKGEPPFIENQIVPDINARYAYAEDIDNDGDIDIFSVSDNSNSNDEVEWHENDGSENFTSHLITSSINNPKRGHVADVDKDGYMDIILSSHADDEIIWYKNDGSQNFTYRVISSSDIGVFDVYPTDIEGDGDMDVLSISDEDAELILHINDGFENFVEDSITYTYWADCVHAADIDGDGDMDVLSHIPRDLVTGTPDEIAWYENENLPSVMLKTPLESQGMINKSPSFSWKSTGVGTKTHTLYLDTDPDPFDGGNIYNAGSDSSYTLPGDLIDGTIYYCAVKVEDEYGGVAKSNVNHFTAINDYQGGLFDTTTVINSNAHYAQDVYAADLDNDGDMDVLSASVDNSGDEVQWYENDGNANFTTHVIETNGYVGDEVFDIHADDVDNDGDIDVLSAYKYNTSYKAFIFWHENDGECNFTQHMISDTARLVDFVSSKDIDLDGDKDIFAITNDYNGLFPSNGIVWYENDGFQNFTLHVISNDYTSGKIHIADLDNDNDFDVLSPGGFWFKNDGKENFSEVSVTNYWDYSCDIYAADLDKDGDYDIVSASHAEDNIKWYENDGYENFTAHTIITNLMRPNDIYVNDMDGDNDIDILSASREDSLIAWYINDGNQNFTIDTISCTASYAMGAYAADLDNDGDLDVLSASPGDHKIAWYENRNESTTWNGSAWDNGVPTITKDAIINGDYTTTGITVCNELTMNGGFNFTANHAVNIDGDLVLNADSTNFSSLIDNGNISIEGKAIIKQYLTNGRWWYISPQVNAANSQDALKVDETTYELYEWVEGAGATNYDCWQALSSTDSLIALNGYAYKQTSGSPISATFEGKFNTGNYGFDNNMSRTPGTFYEGFNLVGNPYPSAIDWGTENDPTPGLAKNNLINTIYVKKDGNYASYNWSGDGTSSNGGSRYIAPGQAIWVRVMDGFSTGTFKLSNQARLHNHNPLLKKPEPHIFRLKAGMDGNTDELVVGFYNKAVEGIDKYDSEKMLTQNPNYPQIFTMCNGYQLVINGKPLDHFKKVVTMGYRVMQPGKITLDAANMNEFNTYKKVYLQDTYQNKMIDLEQDTSYTFYAEASSNITDRFKLIFTDQAMNMNKLNTNGLEIFAKEQTIYLLSAVEKNAIISLSDITGRIMYTKKTQLNKGLNSIEINNIITGVYFIIVNTGDSNITEKIILK